MPKALPTLTPARLRAMCETCGDCLLWQGTVQRGRPYIVQDRVYVPVRRIVLKFAGVTVPAGKLPFAWCRRERCVALKHIAILSQAEIQRISALEGKLANPSRRAAIAATKRRAGLLTPEIVADIRACATGKAAADKHGISLSYACSIRRGQAWADIDASAAPPPLAKVVVVPRKLGKYEVAGSFERAITGDWMLRRQGAEVALA